MDPRIQFAEKHISSKDARILEIGPLNRQIAEKEEYSQSFTVDIRSTEEVKELYCGNDYLKATGISVDAASIVDIDYVLKGTYAETFQGVEQFDYVIASHVLEHVTDIISFFSDIATILKPNGKLLLVYPDKRFCFDHYRESTTFSEAYAAYKKDEKAVAPRVLDFFLNVVHENNPFYFWENYHALSLLPNLSGIRAVEKYKEALQGIKPDDVHYWPFSSEAFLRFLYDLTRTGLLPFTCVDFEDTPMNDQQFFLALQLDMSVPSNPEHAMRALLDWLQHLVDTSLNPDARVRGALAELEDLHGQVDSLNREKDELTQDLLREQNENKQLMANDEERKQAHLAVTKEIQQKIAQLTEKEQIIIKQQDTIGQQQTTINQQQETNKRQQDTNEQQQTAINQQQETIGQQLSTINQQQDTSEQQQAAINQQQETIGQQLSTINQQQETIGQQLVTIKQQQETNEQQQVTISQLQETSEQQQTTIDQQQNTIGQQQATINQQQDTTRQQLATINQQQDTISQQLTTINQLQETIGQQQTTVNQQQETIGQQQTAMNHLQETNGQQLATINQLQGTIEQQQTTINQQQETIGQQQSAMEQYKETIEKQQSALNQQQETIKQQQTTINQHQDTIEQQQTIINQQQETISVQENVFDDQLQEKERALYELNAVFATYSWRVTKPMRIVRTWLRRKE